MTAKKENAQRLGIYLLIVSLFVLLFFVYRKLMNESNTVFFIIYYLLFSFSPAIASLITRAVTKEGFRDMKLHLKLEKNIKWYLLAFGLPLIFFSARILLPIIVSGHSEWFDRFTFQNVLASVFMLAALSTVQSIGLLGEELGWRGYMNQKMEPLFGTVGTCLLGGILWSLWHLPMDLAGWLDGEGSLSDSLMMCGGRMLLLTSFGTFLMWLTKKTDSVFPAVVAHFMFNQSQGALGGFLSQGNIPENVDLGMIASVFEYVPMVILAGIFTGLLLREKKNAPKTA
ncbi:CPBP family intramembrane glutamic endopeptidase [Ruminococcus flavefaciens]|uniref:CAAX protease self-immunity n=1 Tax=Ruminococcus flavefaciens TaxID=1265 RepID=A0A1M7JRY8_RUMFL|nr:type II CAAX endopeptidase family protein [Ruminococcus flavefaciens]SHM55748.1 CAAX protease self-immunity [Ruminococcus flavefaciens]